MAIYIVNTPTGRRLIEARTPGAAINFAAGKDSYTAEALNAPELAHWYDQGLKVESALPEPTIKVA